MAKSYESDEDSTKINRLREELHQSKEEMCVFQSVVLQFLPPKVWNIIHQHQQPNQQQQQNNSQPNDQQQQDNDQSDDQQ